MTFLRCVASTDNGTAWLVIYAILSFLFFCLLLYAVIPIFIYHVVFRGLSHLNRLTRILMILALLVKVVGNLGACLIGRAAGSDHNLFTLTGGGFACLEFPAYVVSTAYTCFLVFWLDALAGARPIPYAARCKAMRAILTAYNVALYVVCLGIVALLVAQERTYVEVYWVGAAFRDLLISAIFLVFAGWMWCGFGRASWEERRLVYLPAVLAALLLARAALPIAQSVILRGSDNSETECAWGFAMWWAISEILLEGMPMAYLVVANNQFFRDKHVAIAERFLSLLDRSLVPEHGSERTGGGV
jgi:hypothetical protein